MIDLFIKGFVLVMVDRIEEIYTMINIDIISDSKLLSIFL